MDASDRDRLLREVAERGDPAQRLHAHLLIETLAALPDDVAGDRAATLLVDAYLNDPYLTR